jgi:hypothetical protein
VPSTSDPDRNRELWEAATRCKAIAVEAKPHKALWKYRADQLPMGVIVRMDKVLVDERMREELRQLVEARKEHGLRSDPDLVLVPDHEIGCKGFADFWKAIAPAFGEGTPEPVAFPAHEGFSDDLQAKVQASERTLIFALGTVTGGSLQHALLGVQTARGRRSGKELEAFVAHARPATYREWTTLRNSFGIDGDKNHQLHYGWLSVLPDRSPLQEEQVLLKGIDSDDLASDAAKAFFEARVELTGGSYGGDEAAALWGSKNDDPESEHYSHLTPDAIYGEHLDVLSTYTAVGSAITAARRARRERAAPELRVFDVAAVARSYYDPLILASFLRWMRPHETWWGWAPADGEATVKHMIERSPAKCRWILVPELLLASAQGKVTRAAADVVSAAARLLLDSKPPEHVAAALEVGFALPQPDG